METEAFPDMATSVVSPEDLVIKSEVVCHYEDCRRVFRNSSALQMHLVKKHSMGGPIRYAPRRDPATGLFIKETEGRKQFFCPIQTCCRGKNSGKPFNKLGNLKQHFHSVHGEKRFVCVNCGKKFGLLDVCRRHEAECGLTFSCACGEMFGNRSALVSHAKRNKHQIPPSLERKSKSNNQQKESKSTSTQIIQVSGPLKIINVGMPAACDSVSTQTVISGVNDSMQCMRSLNAASQTMTTECQTDFVTHNSVRSECSTQTHDGLFMAEHVVGDGSLSGSLGFQSGDEWRNGPMPHIDMGVQSLTSDWCGDSDSIDEPDSCLEDLLLSSVGSQTDISLPHLFSDDLQPFCPESVQAVSTQTDTLVESAYYSEMRCQMAGTSNVSTQTISEILATLEDSN